MVDPGRSPHRPPGAASPAGPRPVAAEPVAPAGGTWHRPTKFPTGTGDDAGFLAGWPSSAGESDPAAVPAGAGPQPGERPLARGVRRPPGRRAEGSGWRPRAPAGNGGVRPRPSGSTSRHSMGSADGSRPQAACVHTEPSPSHPSVLWGLWGTGRGCALLVHPAGGAACGTQAPPLGVPNPPTAADPIPGRCSGRRPQRRSRHRHPSAASRRADGCPRRCPPTVRRDGPRPAPVTRQCRRAGFVPGDRAGPFARRPRRGPEPTPSFPAALRRGKGSGPC